MLNLALTWCWNPQEWPAGHAIRLVTNLLTSRHSPFQQKGKSPQQSSIIINVVRCFCSYCNHALIYTVICTICLIFRVWPLIIMKSKSESTRWMTPYSWIFTIDSCNFVVTLGGHLGFCCPPQVPTAQGRRIPSPLQDGLPWTYSMWYITHTTHTHTHIYIYSVCIAHLECTFSSVPMYK